MVKLIGWKNKFSNVILQRGKNYYNAGYVRNLKMEDNQITAEVGQTFYYDVSISVHDTGTIRSMSCDCPHFEGGYNCKHLAAVLFKVEEMQKKEDEVYQDNTPYDPFTDEQSLEGYYYDLGNITRNALITRGEYLKARKLLDSGRVTYFNVEEDYGTYGDPILDVVCYFEEGYRGVNVNIRVMRDRLDYAYCNNSGCNTGFYYRFNWNNSPEKLCCHKIAALLKLADYIRENDPGDYTDKAGQDFFDSFADKSYSLKTSGERIADIQLVPRLEYDERNNLRLSFKVGQDKLYVARNLPKLYEAYENREVMTLGKNTRIDFAAHDLNSNGRKCLDFISQNLKEEEIRTAINEKDINYYRESAQFSIVSAMVLYGHRMDNFFETFAGQRIEYNEKGWGSRVRENSVSLVDGNPDFSLSIAPIYDDKGTFAGIKAEGELPRYVEGTMYGYCIRNGSIERFPASSMDLMKSLARGSSDNRSISFNVGKKKMNQFYNHIVPELKKVMNIEVSDENVIADNLPSIPEYSFFFDVENGFITCYSQVIYGEERFSLFPRPFGRNLNRDEYGEDSVRSIIADTFNEISEDGIALAAGEDNVVYSVLEELIPKLRQIGDINTTNAFDRLKVKRRTRVNVGVSISNDLLELDIKTDDMSLEELASVIASYRQKKRYHKLQDGTLVSTDDESVESLSELLYSLNIPLKEFVKGKMNMPSYRALYLDSILEKNDALYDNRDYLFRKLIRDFKTVSESDYEVPDSLQSIMRGYQVKGYQWLRMLSAFGFGGILADEMGLGKTLQMIAVLLADKQEGGQGTSLVICPSSLIYNWNSEFRKFAPTLKTRMVVGSISERRKIIESHDECDVLITSYDLLKRDIDSYEGINFRYQILDEAQYIKTHTTANAKCCKAISSQHRFALTGTPIENNLSELWSIFDYLMPGFLYSYETFRRDYEQRIVKEEDEEAGNRLRQMIAPFILRRLKSEVLSDLPEKLEEIISVRFEPEQQKLYDSQVLRLTGQIQGSSKESFTRNKIQILAELTRLRQICCEPSVVYDNYGGLSAKRDTCLELIRNAIDGGHKILLFSQFTSILDVLKKELNDKNIMFYEITGATRKEERLRLVNQFNEDDVPVFLISLKAGGTGLNLTGADIVIHYDPWWNVAAQNQATDRAHRIGQQKVVSVYKIIAEGTVEEKIVELQEKKKELAETILNGDTVSLSSLSKDDLLDLLKG